MNRLEKAYIYIVILIFSVGFANAQDSLTIKGKVINGIGNQPLEKVVITNVSNQEVTETDTFGLYSITVDSEDAVLEIWKAGYQTRRINVFGRENIDIVLFSEDYKSFDTKLPLYKDQTTKREAATSAQLITDDEFVASYPSFESSLQGKTPGLMVINRSGMPGDGAAVFSRGVSSLNLINSPLIVIDDMVYFNSGDASSIISGFSDNPYLNIDPNDIESVSYVKGGTTSLLGSLGGNDVLVIKTKRANDLKTRVTFSSYVGVSSLPKTIPMLNDVEFVDYATSMAQSFLPLNEIMTKYPFLLDNPDYIYHETYNHNTDWQDEVFTQGILQNYSFAIRGGDAIAKYYLSVGYQSHEGIVEETGYQKYSTRFNSDIVLTKKLTVHSNIGFNYRINKLAEFGLENETNPVYSSLAKSPMLHPIRKDVFGNELGTWDPYREFYVSNPVALLDEQDVYSNSVNIITNVIADYEINDNWQANASFGYSFSEGRQNAFTSGVDGNTVLPTENGEAKNSIKHMVSEMNNIYADAGVSYNNTTDKGHSFGFMGGIRYMSYKNTYDFATGMNTVGGDQFVTLGNASANYPRLLSGNSSEFRLLTEYIRLSYDYKKKYFVGLNASLDGSSNYGSNVSKYSLFPGLNSAWLISNENFMKDVDAIDGLKLRFDYAITGNGMLPNGAGANYYETSSFREISGIVRANVANEDLKWEENAKLNIGLDLVTKSERIALSFDIFQHNISDVVLFNSSIPITGFEDVVENTAAMQNTGYDISLNLRIIDQTFKWNVYGNISKYKNEVTSLGKMDNLVIDIPGGQLITKVGGSGYQFYGYETNGVYSSQEQADNAAVYTPGGTPFMAGDMIFVEHGGDANVIGEEDKVVLGDPNPDLYGGFGTSLGYKRFNLTADFTYSYGNEVYNYLRQSLESMESFGNQTVATLNRWRYDGQQASFPQAKFNDPIGNSRFSDRWIEDGSYLRMRELRLSYQLPVSKIIRSGEIYVAGHNLLTLTDYLGYDPEFFNSNDVRYMGVDYGRMPIPKSIILGIKVGL